MWRTTAKEYFFKWKIKNIRKMKKEMLFLLYKNRFNATVIIIILIRLISSLWEQSKIDKILDKHLLFCKLMHLVKF